MKCDHDPGASRTNPPFRTTFSHLARAPDDCALHMASAREPACALKALVKALAWKQFDRQSYGFT
eukprot:3839563-Prymnesium_polylepis.2